MTRQPKQRAGVLRPRARWCTSCHCCHCPHWSSRCCTCGQVVLRSHFVRELLYQEMFSLQKPKEFKESHRLQSTDRVQSVGSRMHLRSVWHQERSILILSEIIEHFKLRLCKKNDDPEMLCLLLSFSPSLSFFWPTPCRQRRGKTVSDCY